MIERLHHTLKTTIMMRKQSWLDALPFILLAIWNMPHEQGFSSAFAITGIQLLHLKLIIDQEYPNLTKDDYKKRPRK